MRHDSAAEAGIATRVYCRRCACSEETKGRFIDERVPCPAKLKIAGERYWERRSGLLYYKYLDSIIRDIGASAKSIIDVGTGHLPYLEWFDWIPEKVAIDLLPPYSSETVRGIHGDIFELSFPKKFDLCTCMQVMEHVPDAGRFARRLMEIGHIVLVSVPHKWPAGSVPGHVHDPVTLAKVTEWFGRPPNYQLIVREPFQLRMGARLMVVYDVANPTRRFSEIKVHRGWPLWVHRPFPGA